MLSTQPNHADWQKASVEVDQHVGNARVIFAALVNNINQARPVDYIIDVNPIIDTDSFGSLQERTAGEITSLTFEFVTPNGLWSADTSWRTSYEKQGLI